jgi:two-component system sensor kinase FixL
VEKRSEDALRESEGRIQAILDTAADAIITIDQLGIIENVNHAAERLFGYSASELFGRNVSMLMPSPHCERHDEYLAHYMRTGEAKVIGIGRELEALRRDGTTFPIELALSEVCGSSHRQFTGIIRDITVRKKAEEALRESQGRIQAILNTAADAIITIDQRGIVESVNPAAERLFGYAASELIGHNVSMLMPSPHREQHDGYLERYIRTGEARVMGIGRELEAMRHDGTTFPIELALSEVRGSNHRQFTGIIRDITVRKKAREALRESQGRIQAILNTAADAIVTIDQRGIVESVNTAAERLFGYSASDLIGHNVSMLIPSPYREQHDEYLERYMRTGEAKVIGIGRELAAMRCDGITFPIELALSEVVGSSHRQFTGIIRDITVRKRAEEALLRADALKDEFLANTSHELRTPLNGIIGIGQSMLDGATGNLTEDQRRNLAMVVASGRRLASLVNDLLDFSKLRHETIELRRRPTDMHALTDLVLTVSRALVGKRPVRLFNRVDPHVPLTEVDDDRILQVLFNLVGNGIKFTPGGAVEVSAQSRDGWM